MSQTKNETNKVPVSQNSKSKRELYSEYVKNHNLESLISEMTNSVVHALSPNPVIYMIKYLTGLLSEEDRVANEISIPPPYPQGVPIVHFPKFKSSNILSKYLTKENWPNLKYTKTKYNNNINILTKLNENNPEDPIGIALVDGDCINSFEEILNNIITDVHEIRYEKDKEYYKTGNFTLLNKEDLFFINENEKKINYIRFQFSRNIDGFSFNNSIRNNSKVKDDITKIINDMINEGIIDSDCKRYVEEDEYKEILDEYFSEEMKWMKDSGMDEYDKDNGDEENNVIPTSNRVVYANEDRTIVILINFTNHFSLLISSKPNNCDIVETYNKGLNIIKTFSLNCQFETHKQFGYVLSDISILGAGLRIFSSINLPNISTFTNIISHSNFSSFKVNNDSLETKQNYNLNEGDEISFVSNYLCKINGLITLSSNKKSFSFDKISFNGNINETPIAKAYNGTYDSMKYTLSSNGETINCPVSFYNSLNNPNESIFLNDRFEYYSFYPFIAKYIKESQEFNIKELNHINKPENPREVSQLSPQEIERIKSINICLFRNIKSYPFSISKKNQNEKIEILIKNTINSLNSKGHYANYFSLSDPLSKTQADELISRNKLTLYHNEKMEKVGLDPNYPNFRGVIQFDKENIYAIVNDVDHIKFYYSNYEIKEDCNLNKELVNLIKVVNELCKYISFEYDKKFGFFTSNPKYVGTGMRIRIQLKLEKLIKEDLDLWVEGKGYIWKDLGDGVIEIENKITIGMSETEMLCNLLFYIRDIFELNESKD